MEVGRPEPNWSEAVEDLVVAGDVDGAIAVLESVIAGLRNTDASPAPPHCDADASLRLAAALGDLADVHASRGRSLQADELRAEALLLRGGAARDGSSPSPSSAASAAQESRDSEQAKERVPSEREDSRGSTEALDNGGDDDDWEAMADGSLPDIAGLSSCQLEDEIQLKATPRRRGRGSFLYKKDGLYSDHLNVGGVTNPSDSEEEPEREGSEEATESSICERNLRLARFGTRHVLVLYDFPPSTRTTELEKLFEGFRDQGVAIRWVHDACALAVFRSPSIGFSSSFSLTSSDIKEEETLESSQ